MILLLYHYVPAGGSGGEPRWGRDLTAVGIWGAAKVLGALFDVHRYNVIYGSLASVMAFLFFVYVVAFILLLGAEFAYAWSQPPGTPGPPLRTRSSARCAGSSSTGSPDRLSAARTSATDLDGARRLRLASARRRRRPLGARAGPSLPPSPVNV